MNSLRRMLATLTRGACAAVVSLGAKLVPIAMTLALSFAMLTPGFAMLAPSAHAQDAPPDVADARGLEIPAAPEGFVHVDRGTPETGLVRWEMPERARGMVEPLFETWDGALPRIRRELGIERPMQPIRIRVGVDPDEMRALAPVGAPPPSYAVGVAYPGLSLILLTMTAPETWQRPELDEVLVHELSHIAMHEALANEQGVVVEDAPLWLLEGVAIYQARERSIERVQTLWEAAFRGAVIPLDDLDQRFPSRPHSVSLAYAESADFVAWLLRRSGPEKLGQMLGRMRRGQDFDTAVHQTWSLGIGSLELEWRDNLSNRFGALPMFATGSIGWVVVGVLIVLAWRRRKDRGNVIVQRWAEEDARQERLELAYARHRARLLARERAMRLAAQGVLAPSAPPPTAEQIDAMADEDANKTRREAILTSYTHEKPTTVFVVGSTSAPSPLTSQAVTSQAVTSQAVTSPSATESSSEEGEGSGRFDHDVDRGDRPLH